MSSKPINISTYGKMKVSMLPSNGQPFSFEAESLGPIEILQDEDDQDNPNQYQMPPPGKNKPLKRSGTARVPSQKPEVQKESLQNTRNPNENRLDRWGSLPERLHDHFVTRPRRNYNEQPVFTSRAHVFFIEPNSGKKEWTPAGAAEGSVPVDICYDHTRHNYKVTSIVDSKPVFSSALSPDYTFIKTSHKFGQWLDTSNGVLYGLGFANETELSNFSKKFNQYKEESTPPPPVTNNNRYSQSNGPLPNSDEEPITLDNGKQYQSLYSASSPFKDLDASPIMDRKHPNEAGVGNKPKQGRHRLHELDGDLNDHSDEAERLKLEWEKSQHQLNQLSRENKRKEEEIEGLRRNNVKLTSAMRESAANVEEWKKLLHKYREDSLEAKNKIAEMEAKQKEREEQLRLSALEDEKIQSLQKELQEKDREIAILNKELLTTQNDNNRLQMDNNRLRSQLDQELNNKSENEGKKKKEQQEMASQMNSKIQELQLMNATLQSKL